MRFRIRQSIGCILVISFLVFNFSANVQLVANMPTRVVLYQDQIQDMMIPIPFGFSLHPTKENIEVLQFEGTSLKDYGGTSSVQQMMIKPNHIGETEVVYQLFGFIPIKTVSVNVYPEKRLIPGGQNVGVMLYTKGALVVGSAEIEDSTGLMRNPAQTAGIYAGDVILRINGTDIKNADHLLELINGTNGQGLRIDFLRNDKQKNTTVVPIKDASDGKYRIGLWVRDSTAGIGTLTYYDQDEKKYAALGHSIADIDTGSKLIVKDGEIIPSTILGIKKGIQGVPGELHGAFLDTEKRLGSIQINCEFGIFGTAYAPIDDGFYKKPISIGIRSAVHEGNAKILTTIDETGVLAFDCEIVRISSQNIPTAKSMIIRITDTKLLDKTGGIIQGMSGSPIIQDGKLIGAVTHVLINDPTRGYGVFIEWMLEAQKGV